MKTSKLATLVVLALMGSALAINTACAVNLIGRSGNNGNNGSSSSPSGPSSGSHGISPLNPECQLRIGCRDNPYPSRKMAVQACSNGLFEENIPGFVVDRQAICMHKRLVWLPN